MRSLALILAVLAAYFLLRGQPEQMPALLRTCVAVLVLVAGLGYWGHRPRPREGTAVSRRSPGGLDYVAIGTAVLALECLFVLFFSAVPEPLEDLAYRLRVWRRTTAVVERGAAEIADGNEAGNWLWNGHLERALPRRTDLKPGNQIDLYLQPADGEAAARLQRRRIYVEAFALGRYEAGVWSARPVPGRIVKAGPDGWQRFPEVRSAPLIGSKVFHATGDPTGNPLIALQGMVAAETPELEWRDEGLYLLPPAGADGDQYRTESRPALLEDLPRGVRPRAAPEVPREWLELPGGAQGERLNGLARRAAGEGDTRQQLMNLRDHLRTTIGYSLRTENRKNLDPLENFLFEEKKGHCEYFATAAALLARSLGVPSRVAYGWAGGTYYEGSNWFVFRSPEAHAWTEVLLEGHGWTVLDATPPAALGQGPAEPAGRDAEPAGTDEPVVMSELPVIGGSGGLAAPLLLAASFLVPALVLMLLRARQAGPGPGWRGGAAKRTDTEAYLAAFRKACRKHGRPFLESRTLRRQVAGMPDAPDFARDLQAYYYAVHYEGRAPDRKEEQRLKKAAEEWK